MVDFDNNIKKSLISNKGEDILRNREQKLRQSTPEQTDVFRKIIQTQKDMLSVENDLSKDVKDRISAMKLYAEQLEALKKAQESLKLQKAQDINRAFDMDIKKYTSSASANQDVSQIQRNFESYGASVKMAQGTSSIDLHRQAQANRIELEQQSAAIRRANPYTDQDKIKELFGQRSQTLGNLGITQAAIATQKKMGMDTASVHSRAMRAMEGLEREDDREYIKQGVKQGSFGSKSSIEQQLTEATSKLIETFHQFDDAVKNSSSEADGLGKAFESTSRHTQMLKDIRSEMISQDRSGGFRDKASSLFDVGGTAVRTATDVGRYVGVDAEFAQMRNKIGLAEQSNVHMQDYVNVARGDYGSFRRLSTNQFGKEQEYQNTLKNREKVLSGMDVTGNVAAVGGSALGAGVEGARAAATLGLSGEPGVKANQLIQNAGGAIKSGVNAVTGISANAVGLEAQSLKRQQLDTNAFMEDYAGNMSLKYAREMALATRGLGAGRERALRTGTQNQGALERLGDVGLGLEDIPKLTGLGRQQLGGEFDLEGTLGAAGKAARSGRFESPEAYLGARGALTGVTGNSDTALADILEKSITRGMDNSKNIMQMVEATTSLANRDYGTGVSGISGITQTLGRSTAALDAAGVPSNMIAPAAANAQEYLNSLTQRKNPSMQSAIKFAGMKQIIPEASSMEMIAAEQLTLDDVRTMEDLKKQGKTQELRRFEAQRGVGNIKGFDNKKTLDAMKREITTYNISSAVGGMMNVSPENLEGMVNRAMAGKSTNEDYSTIGTGLAAQGQRNLSPEAILGAHANALKAQQKQQDTGKPVSDIFEGFLGAPAKQGIGMMKDVLGGTTAQGAGGDLPGILQNITSSLSKLPENYMEAATKAGESLKTPVAEFGEAVKSLTQSMGELGVAIKDIINQVPGVGGQTSQSSVPNGNSTLNNQSKQRSFFENVQDVAGAMTGGF